MKETQTVTMDFFGSQEKARRNTGLLVFLFVIAVILIILCVYLAVSMAIFFLRQKYPHYVSSYDPFNLKLFLYITGGTVALVSLGSLFKIASLGKGGMKVAELLGGKLVPMDTPDAKERRLLNVVEEVSIASGIQMPLVYILEREEGINAFAAGYTPSSAVLGITRGAVENLNRDELQGIVAHEFSHILNGDMRLNIRLIGILHGILLIGITGRVILEITLRSGRHRSRSSRRKGGGAVIVFLGLGVALVVVGYVGVLFGKLIKSAVSRQREFLADAASVQFTRNPGGLGGALKKIGGLLSGSRLQTARAEEASHLFFSNALSTSFLSGMLSTHPPLEQRIYAIDPSWNGEFIIHKPLKIQESREKMKPAMVFPGTGKAPIPIFQGFPPGSSGSRIQVGPEALMNQIGILTPMLLAHASALLSSLPNQLREFARNSEGAKAVVYSLFIDQEEEVRTKQLDYIKQENIGSVFEKVNQILSRVQELGREAHLALLDIAMPSLRGLDPGDAGSFLKNIDELIKADEKVTLFEYALGKILRKTLEPIVTGKADKAPAQYYSFSALAPHIEVLLSALVRAGQTEQQDQQTAFEVGREKMKVNQELMTLLPKEECSFQRVDKALNILRLAAPVIKKRFISGLAWCVAFDKTVTVSEAQLLRAIADTLDCPLPPIVTPPEK